MELGYQIFNIKRKKPYLMGFSEDGAAMGILKSRSLEVDCDAPVMH